MPRSSSSCGSVSDSGAVCARSDAHRARDRAEHIARRRRVALSALGASSWLGWAVVAVIALVIGLAIMR